MKLLSALCAFGMLAGIAFADQPVLIFPPLPIPLVLPPGLTETLPLNKTQSFYGDAMRIVDCADPSDAVYGICGNQLFGGILMTDSHLNGSITIQFSPSVGTISHFVVLQGVIPGDDTVLSGPLGFNFPLKSNQISDAMQLSSGDLDLTSGGVTNLEWYVLFSNTGLNAIGNANPNLTAPVISFPGTRGHAWAEFRQRSDGLLDFYFRGSTFLPLGTSVGGQPVRFPLPFCGPAENCASVLARGMSLHPHLYLNTAAPAGTPCGSNCPDIPTNRAEEFTVHTYYTSYGDDFSLNIPQLGATATSNAIAEGRSQLQGRFQIQFGPQTGDTIPFVIATSPPAALFATAPVNPIAGPGVNPGLLGQNGYLQFPLQTYFLQGLAFVDEPYNFPQGEIDVNTGQVIGQMEYPSFYGQSLADALFSMNAPRISTDPFFLIAESPLPGQTPTTYALFEKDANGETVFRFSGVHRRSFATYLFPAPDLTDSYLAGPGSNLDLFLLMQGAHIADSSDVVKKSSGAFTSSIGDAISYSFSIPCNPAADQPFSFTYTNGNSGASGGTFTLESLANVSCTNSRTSTAPPGDYDTLSFTGFGTWSKDPAGSLYRFASVSVSLDPGNPYFGVLVFMNPDAQQNVVLSGADNKPATKTTP